MIVWSALWGLLAGWLDGWFIPAWHWPPLFSVFCVALVLRRRADRVLPVWIFIIISGLWLDLAWQTPPGVFIIWHAIIYGLAAGVGRYLVSISNWGGRIFLLYLVSFIYFLGLSGLELILGRGRDLGLLAAAVGALATGTGAWLGQRAARAAGRLTGRWFFIKTG